MKIITKNIFFKGFKKNKINKKTKKNLHLLLKEKNEILKSLTKNYNYSYNKKLLLKLKKFANILVIGMGGSTLGTEAIYSFLKHKIKKSFFFVNNLKPNIVKHKEKKILNLIVFPCK